MRLARACLPAIATAVGISSCQSSLQGPDTTDPGSIAGRTATVPNVVVNPTGMVRNVEAQTLTLNFEVATTSLMGTLVGFNADTLSLNKTAHPLATGNSSSRSVTLSLPAALGANYAKFGTSTFTLAPVVQDAPPYYSTIQVAVYPIAPNRGNFLARGEGLFPGECLVATNLAYKVCMQSDGNLVETNAAGVVVWSSGQAGAGPSTLLLSSVGKLSTRVASGTTTWSSSTGWATFTIQGTGSLLLYDNSAGASRRLYLFNNG